MATRNPEAIFHDRALQHARDEMEASARLARRHGLNSTTATWRPKSETGPGPLERREETEG
jgi:hypothetical protein